MKDFLLCVDSDGCAIDGMTVKHLECFGPCFTAVYKLEEHRDMLLKEWNRLNLYSLTRGINRFKGLVAILQYAKEQGVLTMDTGLLEKWVAETAELSNKSLEAFTAEAGSADQCLKLAMEWSLAVNRSVAALPQSKKLAFTGVAECFAAAKEFCDIAVVSSANAKAVEDEWSENGIWQYTDVVMTQEQGSKYDCIKLMLGKGYNPDKVIMVGDAPGDHAAADKAGVLFFPIVPTKETDSWKTLKDVVLAAVKAGSYKGDCMTRYVDEYFAVLKNM